MKDDEEQKAKLQDICFLLVAAGYFRARLKGLSAFDKVLDRHTLIFLSLVILHVFFRLLVVLFGALKCVLLMLMSTFCSVKI